MAVAGVSNASSVCVFRFRDLGADDGMTTDDGALSGRELRRDDRLIVVAMTLALISLSR